MDDLAALARELDANDVLGGFRDRFAIDGDKIYLDGNSLGRPTIDSADAVGNVIDRWTRDLVEGWEVWIDLGTRIGDRLAPLIGASAGEVAVCDQTSVNLFKLASAALDVQASESRTSIVTDAGNFPSDLYVLQAVASARGGDLRVLDADPTVDEIAAAVDETVGMVALTHVSYRSGAMFDGAAVTAAVHAHGALMLWDLSHSAGAVPVELDEWGADLAVGCTYKYLNGGPGAPGYLFVASRHHAVLRQPIEGWFGHADQFGFRSAYEPADDIRRFMVGTPPILSMAAVEAGVAVTSEAGMGAIRAKGIRLSDVFLDAVDRLTEKHELSVITPRDPAARGSHVAVRTGNAYQLSQALRSRGVIVDFRAPDVIRFGFAPLYTTFEEVTRSVAVLESILESGAHLAFPSGRAGVT